MHRFYSPPGNFSDRCVILDEAETRHLRDVVRLKVGEAAVVFDGAGNEFTCKIAGVKKTGAELEIVQKTTPASSESTLKLTLAAVMLKGEKYDLVVQKAVELGVTKIVPLWSERCDVRSKDSAKRLDRWRKIALEASKQSGRATLMEIDEALNYVEFIGRVEIPAIMFAERSGNAFNTLSRAEHVTAIVGPEGGWDDSEIAAAKTHGIPVVTLGGRVLRAETAAIAIAAILQHRLGDLN